jgi:hypothetical protein
MDWLADSVRCGDAAPSAAHWRVSGVVLGVRLVPGLGLERRDSYRYQSITSSSPGLKSVFGFQSALNARKEGDDSKAVPGAPRLLQPRLTASFRN